MTMEDEPIRFRSGKRKTLRRPSSPEAAASDEEPSGSRLTAPRPRRLRGVPFRSEPQAVDAAQPEAHEVAGGMEGRFMHQTGLLTILDDVHMNAFIESRLARIAEPPPNIPDDDDGDEENALGTRGAPIAPVPANRPKDHQPARYGKLFEVAIPEDVRRARDDARRAVDKAAPPAAGRKARARNDDDVVRDNLVDEFLHENRLDVYNVQQDHPPPAAPGRNPSADDRLAEQFRRQFYDEQALRRKRRRPATNQHPRPPQVTDHILRGPKLGGSRNQRAAVRDILLQQQEKRRK